MSESVGIVLVNYNSADDVRRCVTSLRKLSYKETFIVIVDSCSPDGSGRVLQRELGGSTVAVILNPDNRGFAAASNLGMAYALARGATFVWLLNADTEVQENSLATLVEYLSQHADVAAAGSKVLYPSTNGARKIWGAGGKIDWQQRRVQMNGAGEADTGQCEIACVCDYLPGCSILLRSSVIQNVGYLPESYFMYFEETDWCARLTQSGLKLHYVPSSIVTHHFCDDKMQRPFGVYYFNRNSLRFWFCFSSLGDRMKIILNVLLRRVPSALWAYFHAPTAELRAIFRAHLDAYRDFLVGTSGVSERYSVR